MLTINKSQSHKNKSPIPHIAKNQLLIDKIMFEIIFLINNYFYITLICISNIN